MKYSVQSEDQLTMLPGCILLEEIDHSLDIPGIGEVKAEQVVHAKEGVVGVRGAYPQLDVRRSDENMACFKVRAIADDLVEKYSINVGDHVVISALLRLFTPVQVGGEELIGMYVEDGSILATIDAPEETGEGLAELLKVD